MSISPRKRRKKDREWMKARGIMCVKCRVKYATKAFNPHASKHCPPTFHVNACASCWKKLEQECLVDKVAARVRGNWTVVGDPNNYTRGGDNAASVKTY